MLHYPYGIAVDSSGNLFIADTYNNVIRRVDAATQKISTLAGTGTSFGYGGDNGLAADTIMNYPMGVAVDPYGNVFIADASNNRIREVSSGVTVLTITPRPLLLTADSQVRIYGAEIPALTFSYIGFISGEGPQNLMTQPILTTTATPRSHVLGGIFPIGIGSAAASNYTISYVPGKLYVTPAPLVISPNDAAKVYGDDLPTLTAEYDGFVNGDTAANLLAQPKLYTKATAGSHVSSGPYTITAAGALSSDYTISYVPGELTITPAPLTIKADDKNKVYGEALPAFTATVTGLVNDDPQADIVRNLRFVPDANATSPASGSPYAIQVFAEATRDYTIITHGGELIVSEAPTTVTLGDLPQKPVYGEAIALTATASVDGATGAPTDGTVTFYEVVIDPDGDGQTTKLNPLGDAAILTSGVATLEGVSLSAGSHTIQALYRGANNYEDADSLTGTISVQKAEATIDITGATAGYNAAAHGAVGTASGAEQTDPADLASGLHLFYSSDGGATFSQEAPINAGAYQVYYTFDGNTNYAAVATKTDRGRSVVISQATPTAKVGEAGGTYNGSAFAATVTIAGIDQTAGASLEGVTPTLTYYAGDSATGSLLSGAPTAAGTYTVVASFAGSANYAAAGDQITFTITKAPTTIQLENLPGGVATLEVVLPAGNYRITASSSGAANYQDPQSGDPVVLDVAPVGTPNERYIQAVYRDVLGRNAEPDAVQYWSELIDSGASISNVAYAVVHSGEYYANFVVKPVYLSLLNREAEEAGLWYWVAALQGGMRQQQLQAFFLASDEFYAAAGADDGHWVEAVYQQLLNRTAEPEGKQFWLDQLAQGQNRFETAANIAQSAENDAQIIIDDYLRYLGREPEPAGLAFWLKQFDAGLTNEDLIAGFTGSEEYFQTHAKL